MRKPLVILALVVSVPAAAVAQTIQFGALPGTNGDLFTQYTESGFTVASSSGALCVAKVFGNPEPDLVGGNFCASEIQSGALRITRTDGGAFRFLAVDLSSNAGATTYGFQGFLASVSQFGGGTTLTGPTGFATYGSGNGFTPIDELFLSFTPVTANSYNVDNIALIATTVVPEPSTMSLMLAGVLGIAAFRSRRRRR